MFLLSFWKTKQKFDNRITICVFYDNHNHLLWDIIFWFWFRSEIHLMFKLCMHKNYQHVYPVVYQFQYNIRVQKCTNALSIYSTLSKHIYISIHTFFQGFSKIIISGLQKHRGPLNSNLKISKCNIENRQLCSIKVKTIKREVHHFYLDQNRKALRALRS